MVESRREATSTVIHLLGRRVGDGAEIIIWLTCSVNTCGFVSSNKNIRRKTFI